MSEELERDTAFYDATFAASPDELNSAIRRAAFGEDIGQFSWTTADEHRRFQHRLGIGPDSSVLEVASGSGGPALFLVRSTGCRLVGIDIHAAGITAANDAAAQQGLSDNASFLVHDDATENIAAVAAAWHRARTLASRQLNELEGPEANATFQHFLHIVHLLSAERRLSRLAYTARKPLGPSNSRSA